MKDNNIFERYEEKYLLSPRQFTLLKERLSKRITADDYGETTIYNIYYDTPSFSLIRTSLDKPIYKEKLRLRSYGIPKDGSSVFAELKKKYKGVVYKRRVEMKYRDALAYLDGGKPPFDSQIIREIDYFKKFYNGLSPTMFLSYDRVAAYANDNHDVRITFDRNITWRSYDLDLTHGAYGEKLLSDGEILMEIKIPGAFPLWLSHELDRLEIYPISFSKYGKAYERMCAEKTKSLGGVCCA